MSGRCEVPDLDKQGAGNIEVGVGRGVKPAGGVTDLALVPALELRRLDQNMRSSISDYPYLKKELLKARDYRWNPDGPFWQIEVPPEKVEHEQAWGYRNALPAMTTRTVTAPERPR